MSELSTEIKRAKQFEQIKQELEDMRQQCQAWKNKFANLFADTEQEIQYRVSRENQLRGEMFRRGQLSLEERSLVAWGIAYGRSKMAWDLAVCKNGTPLVGTMETPYKEFAVGYWDSMKHEEQFLGLNECQLTDCSGCPNCKPKTVLLDGVEVQ